jgi:hypothetical protein
MGLADRLRAMFGAKKNEADKVREEEEKRAERIQGAVDRERAAAAERVVQGPSSLDEHP